MTKYPCTEYARSRLPAPSVLLLLTFSCYLCYYCTAIALASIMLLAVVLADAW